MTSDKRKIKRFLIRFGALAKNFIRLLEKKRPLVTLYVATRTRYFEIKKK